MDQEDNNSRQNPSISRGQNGQNSRSDDPVDNKDITNRRKCPDCDGRLSKESNKSKSRVWKKVMWFTRRSKVAKNDICQCQTADDGFINSNVEDRHSNSWSFTRSASRKFRISSQKRQCKSESSKKSLRVRGKQDEACTSHESSLSSTRTGSICSSGANSPTATGSFCDFGAASHAGGRGSRRHKNTFVLTEIAREINPPVRNDDLPLSDIHHPPKQLSKSSSSVSHLSRRCMSPMAGNVRRSKSFPGSHSYMSPPKRRFTSTPYTAFATSSPPVKQKCYGLRRTATYCGKLNTEFPKMGMKKSKSVSNAELTKHGKSTSLCEIRDQSGIVVGVIHFYKSPKKLARRVSSFNREVKKDCMFEEEEFGCPAVDQTSSNVTSVSQEGSRACLNTDSTIFESQRHAGLLPESSSVSETSQRNYEETSKDDVTASFSSPPPLERTSKSIRSVDASLSLSNINKEINNVCSNQDKPTLCNNEPVVSSVLYNNEPVQELGFDLKDDPNNVKNVGGSNYVDVNNGEVDISNVSRSSNINNVDSSSGCAHTGLLSSMTKQGAVAENVNGIEKIIQCEPSSTKDESLSSTLLSKGEMTNISNLQTVSETSELSQDDYSSGSSYQKHYLLTEPSTSVASQQSSENVESENCDRCGHHHGNQLRPELHPSSATSEQTSEDVKLPYHYSDDVSGNRNGNQLLTKHVCVSPKSHQGLESVEDFALETEGEIVSNESERCTNDFTESTPNPSSVNLNDICVDNASLLERSEDSFCSYNASQSKTSTDRCLECEISIDSTSFPEIIDDSGYSNDACQSNTISCGDSCLESGIEITEQLDGLTAPGERDLAFGNDAILSRNCPCIIPEDDLTLEVFDNQFNTNNVAAPDLPNEKCQMRVHSSMIASSEIKPNSPRTSIKSASDPVDLHKESATNILCPQNCENSRNVAIPVMAREEFEMRRHSSANTSPEVLECSRTSDYSSLFDESFSAQQNDVPIHTWKTSESDLKSDEIGLPVPGETFKRRTELMLSWFEEFNDEQRNIILKKILNRCELPQMHLLSVAMENNLHKTCPPNCQDMLVWLPYTVTLKILMYLDPVSLCRCNQVNRAWNELTDNSLLWQRLTRNPDHQLSEASSKRQYQKFTQGNGEIHWKKVFAERFLLQRNWLNGKYKLRTFEGHNQECGTYPCNPVVKR